MTKIAFSKLTSRMELGQEPIISTSMNTVEPCYGRENEQLVLGEQVSKLISFPIELENPLQKCSVYDWRKNLVKDKRYYTFGATNIYALQESNGVID